MAEDHYPNRTPGLHDPPRKLVEITPNDDADLEQLVRGIYVGSAGDVVLIAADDADDAPVTFASVPAGTQLVVRARRVLDTGTTAGDLVGYL